MTIIISTMAHTILNSIMFYSAILLMLICQIDCIRGKFDRVLLYVSLAIFIYGFFSLIDAQFFGGSFDFDMSNAEQPDIRNSYTFKGDDAVLASILVMVISAIIFAYWYIRKIFISRKWELIKTHTKASLLNWLQFKFWKKIDHKLGLTEHS